MLPLNHCLALLPAPGACASETRPGARALAVGAARAFALTGALACALAWSTPGRASPAQADCADGPGVPAARTLRETPALAGDAAQARAAWLDATTLRWAGMQAEGGTRFRLLHAPLGGLRVSVGEPAQGAAGALALEPVAPEAATPSTLRFSHIAAGVTLRAANWPAATQRAWHRGQLLLVQEDAQGHVRAATRVQHAGAIDALYAAAEQAHDLGAVVRAGRTHFGLW
ncbi:MAG: hypothetical protein ACKO5J_11785, partial [Rubrivivax sp.]